MVHDITPPSRSLVPSEGLRSPSPDGGSLMGLSLGARLARIPGNAAKVEGGVGADVGSEFVVVEPVTGDRAVKGTEEGGETGEVVADLCAKKALAATAVARDRVSPIKGKEDGDRCIA